MHFDGAVIKEQGVTFGIVIVKSSVLDSPTRTDEMMEFGVRAFGPMPIILMAQDLRGRPTYKGRTDIVKFLANVNPARIPFRRYTI